MGLCPGVSVQGVSLSGGSLGVSVQGRGFCPQEGSLSRGCLCPGGVSVWGFSGGLCPGEGFLSTGGVSIQGVSLSRGVSVQGVPVKETPTIWLRAGSTHPNGMYSC